jgi:superfamily II DNA or RNA helicase
MPTGAGKTVCFSKMMIDSMMKSVRSAMVVRGRKLVDQASRRLFRESVNHGVMMASHWNRRPQAPIQICSIDTMHARGSTPDAKLIIIDECDQATSDAYKLFLDKYPDAFVVGVTATPYTSQPLNHIAQVIVRPISMKELVARGFLVKPRYFTSGQQPDLSGVKTSKGDYVQSQLAQAMDKSTITGDIVSHYLRIGESRPALCFAINVAHSCHIVAQFNAAGVAAVHCDADTPEAERERAIEQLQSGQIKVISNVGIFGRGVDIPCVSCLILARPTKSYNLYVQQVGRGTRTHPGKSDFIVLDHGGNVPRHGCVMDEPDANLDGKQPKFISEVSTCTQCYAVYKRGEECCPECGYKVPPQERSGPIFVDGDLEEWKPAADSQEDLAQAYCEDRVRRYNSATISVWKAYYDTAGKFGDHIARKVFFSTLKGLGLRAPTARRENSTSS